jgi:hypothetical protein
VPCLSWSAACLLELQQPAGVQRHGRAGGRAGELPDDIEGNVGWAKSFVRLSTLAAPGGQEDQKSTRKWTCIAILIVSSIVLKN